MSIQRHFILFILSLLVIAPSIAHQKPYVINFARDKYHAANKNWTIGQDEKGITYFGNDIGLLEFDGIEWKIYQMPNFSLMKLACVPLPAPGAPNRISFIVSNSICYENCGEWVGCAPKWARTRARSSGVSTPASGAAAITPTAMA